MAISSEKIKKDIVDQLYWDNSVDTSEVMVEVSDGRARLSGTVPSFTAKQAAYRDALVPGVTSVQNDLIIEMPPAIPASTDDEIKERAEHILQWNVNIDAVNITVSVDAGRVTLSGSVDAYWRKKRAEELVSAIIGVLAVDNALAVVPTESRVDKSIADDITAAFERNMAIDINTVDVKVEDGIVTLSGKVSTWNAMLTAEEIALYTAGVIDVVNDLSVETF